MEKEKGLYDEFMEQGEEQTPPKPDDEKKSEDEKKDEPIPTEEKPLGIWEFVHHDNGNVTMGKEMFTKLMARVLD